MRMSQVLTACLNAGTQAILVRVAAVHGSTPREVGAMMLVSADGAEGTIGGGALEMEAILEARRMLHDGASSGRLDIPLGPSIGQCCGGRAELSLERAHAALAETVAASEVEAAAAAPCVLVFGAGHTGQALAAALAPLPFRVRVVDTRPHLVAALPAGVERVVAALPEAEVTAAPRGTAFVIVTHDHALDFLIGAAALRRTDSPYVGMIGSATKRERFRRHLADEGLAGAASRLHMPIGGTAVHDKRPAVIAAMVAAELCIHILGSGGGKTDAQALHMPMAGA